MDTTHTIVCDFDSQMAVNADGTAFHPVVLDAMKKTEHLPVHVQAAIANKYLNNLRLCMNAPVPDGFHGPELMPHMLLEGVTPTPLGPWPVKVVPSVKATVVDEPQSSSKVDTKYAIIPRKSAGAVVDINEKGVKSIIVPQQPFEIPCGGITVNCAEEPIRLTTNLGFSKLYVQRVGRVSKKGTPTRFYLVLERDHIFSWLSAKVPYCLRPRFEFVYRSWRNDLPQSIRDTMHHFYGARVRRKKRIKDKDKHDTMRDICDRHIHKWIKSNGLDNNRFAHTVGELKDLGTIFIGQLKISSVESVECDFRLLLQA